MIVDDFYEQFLLEITNEHIDSGSSPQEVFFNRVTDLLLEEGDIKDAIYTDFKRPGLQFNGYAGNPLEDNRRLSIFLLDFTQSEELEGLYLKDLDALVKRGTNFLSKIKSKEFLQIEESHSVFSAIQNLSGKIDLLSQIRIIILTNKSTKIRSSSITFFLIFSFSILFKLFSLKKLFFIGMYTIKILVLFSITF